MLTRCSAKQLAEAVILWSVQIQGNPVLCLEREDADNLKNLDLFLSTIDVFKDGFDGKFEIAYDEHKMNFRFSKNSFIDYLKPRCLLLAKNNGCFDLIMICAFVSHAILALSYNNKCFHLSRVACKLLTTVLEERFSEIFTDCGWENLMSYCKKVHDLVFPSKENRPPGHSGYCTDNEDSEKNDSEPENKDKTERKDIELDNKLSEMGKISDAEFTVTSFSKELEEGNSPVAINSPDDESSDDNSVYWDYETMSNWTICKRVADNRNHLSDVLHCLDMLKESMDTENISSNKYDISVSDDEDVKNLKKREVRTHDSEFSIKFSDRAVASLSKEICQKKNEELGNSSQNQVRPEDITDEDILKHFLEILVPSKDEPQCELCDGKIDAFKTNWLESYHERYSNYELVSDGLQLL